MPSVGERGGGVELSRRAGRRLRTLFCDKGRKRSPHSGSYPIASFFFLPQTPGGVTRLRSLRHWGNTASAMNHHLLSTIWGQSMWHVLPPSGSLAASNENGRGLA